MELAAENKQQLSRLEFAKKIVEKVPANSSWQDWGTLDWGLKWSFQSWQQYVSLASPHPAQNLHIQV